MSGHFLVFEVGGRRAAIPVACVGGILPQARVTPVPFVPDWVDGLITAQGAVLPQIDLAARLFGKPGLQDSYKLLRIWSHFGHFAAKIDRVLRLAEGELHPPSEPNPAIAAAFSMNGEEIVVIDPDRTGLDEWKNDSIPVQAEAFTIAEVKQDDESAAAQMTVVVDVAGEHYAFSIQHVIEVLDLANLDRLPMAPMPLLGLMALREQEIPVLSLAALGSGKTDGGAKVLVITIDRRRVGLLVDRIVGLERIGKIEDHEMLDSRRGIAACWVSHGRPVGLIQPETMIDEAMLTAIGAFLPRAAAVEAKRAPEPHCTFLTFTVGNHLCALDLGSVERVVEWREPVAAPSGSAGLDGVIQVLGAVLPVFDLGRRLGLDGKLNAYLIANLGREPAALAIGQPRRLAAVPLSAIHTLGAGKRRMIDAVTRIDGALAWVLSPAAIHGEAAA